MLFLERADIAAVLVAPRDLREIVAERRERHARQHRDPSRRRVVGKAPSEEPVTADRFDGARLGRPNVRTQLRRHGRLRRGSCAGRRGSSLTHDDFGRIQPGDIIVCPSSNPSWVPVFTIAGGLVTNTGGVVLSHAAVVARELGLPAVVGVADATEHIADGRLIEIDGGRGIVSML